MTELEEARRWFSEARKTVVITDSQEHVLIGAWISLFNEFNGPKVVKELMAKRDLWISVAWGHWGVNQGGWHLLLRDLPEDYLNLSTMYVLCPTPEAAQEIIKRAKRQWKADEADLKQDNLRSLRADYGEGATVVRLWWD